MYNQGSTKLYNVLMGNINSGASNAIGRYAGESFSQPKQGGNLFTNALTGFGDNLKNRARAAGNAISTTIAAPISFANDVAQNRTTDYLRMDSKNRMNAVAKKYGYNTYQDIWDARDAAEAAGDTETLNKIDNVINPELQAQAASNAKEMDANAAKYEDYRNNDFLASRINQDQGKFAGDALTTLSTAADIAAMTTGLPMGVLANATQGGVEGVANELSANGFENFDWGRAGQNALIGAASGAATAGLSSGLNSLAARNGGAILKQGGAIKNVANKALNSSIGRGALSGTVGGAVGGGLGAALNNQDVGAGILQGASQGAVSGAVGGGIMGAANKIGGKAISAIDKKFGTNLGEISQTGKRWQESGDNFNERLTNTLNSGDSAVGNWINGRQSKTLGRLGTIGNSVQDASDNLTRYISSNDPEEQMAELRALVEKAVDSDTRRLYGAPSGVDSALTNKTLRTETTNDILRGVVDELKANGTFSAYQNGKIDDVQYFGAVRDAMNSSINNTLNESEIQRLMDNPTTAGGWLKKAGKRVVEDLNNRGVGLSIKDTGNELPEDVAGLKISRNDMLDATTESPETELYRQLTGDSTKASSNTNTVAKTTTGGDAWDNLAREYGFDNYNDAISAFKQANPNSPVTAGAVTTWLDSTEGSYNPNAVATTSENPLEKVFENKSGKIQKQNKVQAIGKALENAGEGVTYSEVYDALDPKTATRAQKTKAVQKLSEMGVKPRDYEEYAKTSSYVNQVASELASKSNVKVVDPDLATKLLPANLDVNLTDDAAKTYNNYIKQIVADGANPDEYTAGYLLEKTRWLGDKAQKVGGKDAKDIRQALTAAKWVIRDEVSDAMAKNNITGENTAELIAQGLKDLGANEKVIDYYTAPGKGGKAPNISELINRSSLFEQARDMGTQIGAEAMTRSASKYPAGSLKSILRAGGVDQLANLAAKQLVAPITGGLMKAGGKAISAVGNAASNLANTPSSNQTAMYDLLNRNAGYNIIGREAGLDAGGVNKPAEEYIAQASAADGYVAPLGATTTVAPTTLEGLTTTGAIGTTTPTTLASTLGDNRSVTNNAIASATTPNYTYTDIIAGAMERAAAAGDADAFATLYGMYNDAVAELQSQSDNSSKLSAAQQTQLAKFDSAEDAINELEDLYNQAGGGKGAILGWLQERGADLTLDSNARTYRQMAEGLVNQIAQAIGKTDSLNTEGEVKRALQLVPSLTDDAKTAQNKLKTLRQMLDQTKANYYNAYGVAY